MIEYSLHSGRDGLGSCIGNVSSSFSCGVVVGDGDGGGGCGVGYVGARDNGAYIWSFQKCPSIQF